jgi:hypothetical protein
VETTYAEEQKKLFPSLPFRSEDAQTVDGFEKLKAHGITQQDLAREINKFLRKGTPK